MPSKCVLLLHARALPSRPSLPLPPLVSLLCPPQVLEGGEVGDRLRELHDVLGGLGGASTKYCEAHEGNLHHHAEERELEI